MPAFTLDIKTPDTLQKMVDRTTKSLQKMATYENKINYLRDKGVKNTRGAESHDKKREQNTKKEITFAKKLAENYLWVKDAVRAAFTVAKAMTLDLVDAVNSATQASEALKFKVNELTAGTKLGEQWGELEKLSKKTGVNVNELAKQFVKAREASDQFHPINNKDALALTMMYSDIRALSSSAEEADKITSQWIDKFKEGPHLAAQFKKELQGAHEGWSKIGTGEIKTTGVQSLMDKIADAKKAVLDAIKPLVDVVDKIAGQIATALAAVFKNTKVRNFIKEMAADLQAFVNALPGYIDKVKKFFTDISDVAADFYKTSGDKLNAIGDWFKKILPAGFIEGAGQMYGGEKQVPPPQVVPPAPKPKAPVDTGYNAPRVLERQLAGITIQNLNVNGSGQNAEQIARSVRQEMQLLLQAVALSKGYV